MIITFNNVPCIVTKIYEVTVLKKEAYKDLFHDEINYTENDINIFYEIIKNSKKQYINIHPMMRPFLTKIENIYEWFSGETYIIKEKEIKDDYIEHY